MKEDGMLDDPSYVAYECKCVSHWVQFKEPTEEIEVDSTEELDVKAKVHAAAGKLAKKSSDHLSSFTCACIIIIAIQCIMCFTNLIVMNNYFSANKLHGTKCNQLTY